MKEKATVFLVFCGAGFIFALPHGVRMAASGLMEGSGSSRLWLGLSLLVAGVVGLECFPICLDSLVAEVQHQACPSKQVANPPLATRRSLSLLLFLDLVMVGLLQLITVTKFFLILDGHVLFRACVWMYFGYAAGAALVLAGWKASTAWGSRYLRWGWAPVIAFGVPLSLPTLKAVGLAPFSPLQW